MRELKNKLNELIEEYGLRHEKVLAYSQELDGHIALEQKERLNKIGVKDFKMDILEDAEKLNQIATYIAKKKGVTIQEVWNEAFEELKLIKRAEEDRY